jgi:hypothetical protein
MRRRRRRMREIPFSFDSFLDVVANVVGIIIRLILVVWVGAKSYSSVQEILKRPHSSAPLQATEESPKTDDPLAQELVQYRDVLAQARARLQEQLRHVQEVLNTRAHLEGQLTQVLGRRKSIEQERTTVDQTATEGSRAYQTTAFSLSELQTRQKRLLEAIQILEKQPPVKKLLRYQTPLSQPVQAEEFMFECREGRVTFIDLASLQVEVRRHLEAKGQLLRTRWQVSDVTSPVGAFRLRYTLERAPNVAEAVVPGTGPDTRATFNYGLTEWQVEPVAETRGEPAPAALAKGSDFRRIADALDPQQAVVTFWVYPDSFALFRQLRDYLYERGLVVAGRPLPLYVPISANRHGSLSRGQ